MKQEASTDSCATRKVCMATLQSRGKVIIRRSARGTPDHSEASWPRASSDVCNGSNANHLAYRSFFRTSRQYRIGPLLWRRDQSTSLISALRLLLQQTHLPREKFRPRRVMANISVSVSLLSGSSPLTSTRRAVVQESEA